MDNEGLVFVRLWHLDCLGGINAEELGLFDFGFHDPWGPAGCR